MKNITRLYIIIAVLCTLNLQYFFAQVPLKLSYQAIIRNSNNTLVSNSKVGLQISVLQGSATGTPVYIESLQAITNAVGMVGVEFGGNDGFNSIAWASSIYFIKTEVDPLGGTNYSITGVSQLLSVPSVFRSKTTEGIECMTQYQIEALPPVAGLLVYNTTSKEFVYFDGSIWKSILNQ